MQAAQGNPALGLVVHVYTETKMKTNKPKGWLCEQASLLNDYGVVLLIKHHALCFWGSQHALHDENTVIVNGQHFRIGCNTKGRVGHAGTTFMVKFHDGRVVMTTNLWSQGTIDPEWREVLPDNATFDPMFAHFTA